jgi:hypothetical protein
MAAAKRSGQPATRAVPCPVPTLDRPVVAFQSQLTGISKAAVLCSRSRILAENSICDLADNSPSGLASVIGVFYLRQQYGNRRQSSAHLRLLGPFHTVPIANTLALLRPQCLHLFP